MKIPQIPQKIFDIPVGKGFRINIWTIPMLVTAFFSNYGELFLFAYLSSALHELAHILCAKALNIGISYIQIYPFGIAAHLENEYIRSSEKEFFISFAGPFCSLIFCWIFSFFEKIYPIPQISFLTNTNLALCFINLLPILPLDGGRMLKSILTTRFGIIRAYRFMLKISKIMLIFLVLFILCLIFASKFNFSLVLITAFLLQNLVFEHQAISVISLKEILSNHQKSKHSENLPTRVLCVCKDRPASGIIRHLSYDCFYVVNIMDKNSSIIKTVTEVEILDTLIKKGIRTKYQDI
ncbi:MAG: site-2 protease family protein [Clostridia bacterium]|nr:site-2 protease family protein [Clostridia bacterium]